MIEHYSNIIFLRAVIARWRMMAGVSVDSLYTEENRLLRAFIHGAALMCENEETFEELCFLRLILEERECSK